MKAIKLIVPGSTSNLGPGFDTLGLAVDWYLQVTGERTEEGMKIDLPPKGGAEEISAALSEMVMLAVQAWENAAGEKAGGMRLAFSGDLPVARGLGSSAAYRLATVHMINRLCGSPLDPNELLELVCGLEKHTDNAVPCAVGGLTISGWDKGRVRYVRYKMASRFRLVALVPEHQLATVDARSVLPATVLREDAVFNLQRALWLVNALVNDEADDFSSAFQDRLHQPYREKLMPFFSAVITAAQQAGAYGAFLSGAGSTIIALAAKTSAEKAGQAMLAALQAKGEKGFVRTLKPDHLGLRFLEK